MRPQRSGFASASPFRALFWVGPDVAGRKRTKMVASAMTRRDALAALGAFGLSLTGAASGARAQSGLRFRDIVVNVEPLRARDGDPTAAWMEQALRQALPRALGASFRAGRQKRRNSRGPDRLDLSRPELRRPGAERLGAGHDHRKLRGSRTARRNCVSDPVAGDRVLLSDAPSIRRSSSEPITGASPRSVRPSPAGRRGSLGFRPRTDGRSRAGTWKVSAACGA